MTGPRRHAPFAAIVVALGVAASACSSGSGNTTATGPSTTASPASSPTTVVATTTVAATSDPCGYVTKDEVAAAIGTGIAVARAEGSADARQCAYFPDPTASQTSNGLYVQFRRTAGAAYDALRRNPDAVAVAGIGDDAFWLAPFLRVKVAGGVLTIAVMDTRWNHGDSKGAAVRVAQAAVARLH